MREKFERNSSGWLGWFNNPQMLHLHANPETPKGPNLCINYVRWGPLYI